MARTDLTNNHTKQGQETNQIRTQETGKHYPHDRGLTHIVYIYIYIYIYMCINTNIVEKIKMYCLNMH